MGEKDRTTRKMLRLMQTFSVNVALHLCAQPVVWMSPHQGLRLTTVGAPRPCGRRHAELCQSSLLRFQITPAQCGEWAEIPVAASGRLPSLLEKNGGKLGITSKTDVTQDVVRIKTRPASCRHHGRHDRSRESHASFVLQTARAV